MAVVLFWPVVALLVAAAIGILLIFNAFLSPLSTRGGSMDAFLVNNAGEAIKDFLAAIVLGLAAVYAFIVAAVANVLANWRWYGLFGIIAILAYFSAANNQVILTQSDKYITTIVLPVYRDLVIPVFNLLRLIFEILVTWWNFFWQFFYLVPISIFNTLLECVDAINGQLLLQNIIAFFQSVFTFVAAFLTNFESDLQIAEIYAALVAVINVFTPWVNCFCQDLAFGWNAFANYINQVHFQRSGGPTGFFVLFPPSDDLINAILNFIRTLIRLAFTLILAAFDPGPYDPFQCGTPDYTCIPGYTGPPTYPIGQCNDYVTCQMYRAPQFNAAFDYLCLFANDWLQQWDDMIWSVLLLFFDGPAEAFPRPASIFIGIACFIIRLIQGFVDFLFKLDLVFNTDIRYASRINVTLQFNELRNTSVAIQTFFNTFRVEELSFIGCGLAELFLGLVGALQFFFEFLIAFSSFDFDYIAQFLADYNYTANVLVHFENAIVCIRKALELINVDWAIAFEWISLFVVRAINLLFLTFSRFDKLFSSNPEDYLIWYTIYVTPGVFQLMDTAQRAGIALGNCIRTFDKFLEPLGLSEHCTQVFDAYFPPVNMTTNIIGIDFHAGLFCVSGDLVQAGSQLVISLVQLVVHIGTSIMSIISNPGLAQLLNLFRLFLDDLELFIVPSFFNILNSFSGFIASLGSFIGCQDATGNFAITSGPGTAGVKFKLFLLSIVNILHFPVDFTLISGETLGYVIQCSTDASAKPIFLQQPTGCETATVKGESIAPPIPSTCSGHFFDDIILVVCRYLFSLWDWVLTWFPRVLTRLVDFILCLAVKNAEQGQSYFQSFYDFLQTIRCLLCDIVRIVVAIIQAFIYLFSPSEGGFGSFVAIITCFPPFNSFWVMINTLIECVNQLKSGSIPDISSINQLMKGQKSFFCAPTRPPCGLPAGTPKPSWWPVFLPYPPPIPSNSPLLPCYVVNTYFFKRQVDYGPENATANYEFTSIPLDGQQVLVTKGFLWDTNQESYNFTSPLSPCGAMYAEMQFIRAKYLPNPIPAISLDAARYNQTFNSFKYCAWSCGLSNQINSMFPLMTEHPLPPDVFSNFPAMLFYLITFAGHFKDALSFYMERVGIGGSSLMSWNQFKQKNGITSDFVLTIVSAMDQATSSTSSFLSGMSGFVSYMSVAENQRKRGVIQPKMSPQEFEQFSKFMFTVDKDTKKSKMQELQEWIQENDYNMTFEPTPFPSSDSFDVAGNDTVVKRDIPRKDYHEYLDAELYQKIKYSDQKLQKQENQQKRKRDVIIGDYEYTFGEFVKDDIDLGNSLGRVTYAGTGAWKAFQAITTELTLSNRADGTIFKRDIPLKHLHPVAVRIEMERRRKRNAIESHRTDEEVISQEVVSYEEASRIQSALYAFRIQSELKVLLNFTKTVFYRVGSIPVRAINNTIYNRTDINGIPQAPFLQRRGIVNFFMHVRSAMNRNLPLYWEKTMNKRTIEKREKTGFFKQKEQEKLPITAKSVQDVTVQMQALLSQKRQGRSILKPFSTTMHQTRNALLSSETQKRLQKSAVLITPDNAATWRNIFYSNSLSSVNSHNEPPHLSMHLRVSRSNVLSNYFQNSTLHHVVEQDMIKVSDGLYTTVDKQYEQSNRYTFYVKRDDLSHYFDDRNVYLAINYPDGGFVFGGQVFPLVDLCVGSSRELSVELPPFGNVALPGFCFNCNLFLEIINRFTYYLGHAVNETALTFADLQDNQAYNPIVRTTYYAACGDSTTFPTGATCCSDCNCDEGNYCSGSTTGTCSYDGRSCCSPDAYNTSVCPIFFSSCVGGKCTGSATNCTSNSQCPVLLQTCENFTPGICTLSPATPPPPPYPPIVETGASFTEILINILWWIPGQITGVTPQQMIDAVNHFFTAGWDSDNQDTSTFSFWLQFTVTCDPILSTTCNSRPGLPGAGLIAGFFWVLGVFIGITIVAAYLAIPSTFFIVLWVAFVPIWWAVSYAYQPLCFPQVPNCLGNDVYWYLSQINVDCINWQGIFGGAVAAQCSLDENQCYDINAQIYFPVPVDGCPTGTVPLGPNERYFPDCNAEPYNYDAAFRLFFVGLQAAFPDLVSFLNYTQSPTLKYIRTIPVINEGLGNTPIFINGTLTKDQAACMVFSGLNGVSLLIFYGVFFFVLAFILYLILRIIIAIVDLFIAMITVGVLPVTGLSTSTTGSTIPAAPSSSTSRNMKIQQSRLNQAQATTLNNQSNVQMFSGAQRQQNQSYSSPVNVFSQRSRSIFDMMK